MIKASGTCVTKTTYNWEFQKTETMGGVVKEIMAKLPNLMKTINLQAKNVREPHTG